MYRELKRILSFSGYLFSVLFIFLISVKGFCGNFFKSNEGSDRNDSGTCYAKQRNPESQEIYMTNGLFRWEKDSSNMHRKIFSHRGVITGKVSCQETGKPLFLATIYLEEFEMGTITSFDGKFMLDVPVGTYSIAVNCPGYQPAKIKDITLMEHDTVWQEILLPEVAKLRNSKRRK